MSASREAEIAWAAGLFEGEGSFAAVRTGRKNRRARAYAALSSTDQDVVERFARIVGVGRIYAYQPRGKPHYKPAWRWQVGGEADFLAVAELLGSHLGIRRSARLAEVREQVAREKAAATAAPIHCACGRIFTPRYRRENIRFCSTKCSQRWGAKAAALSPRRRSVPGQLAL